MASTLLQQHLALRGQVALRVPRWQSKSWSYAQNCEGSTRYAYEPMTLLTLGSAMRGTARYY